MFANNRLGPAQTHSGVNGHPANRRPRPVVIGFAAGLFLTTAIVTASRANAPQSDQHVAVLLLENGLLVVRIDVSLDGRSLAHERNAYIDRLVKVLDSDGDGKLIRREIVRSPFLTASGQPQGNAGFLDVFRNMQSVDRDEVVRTVESIGGKTVGFRDERTEAEEDAALFSRLDSDGSGSLDESELRAADRRIMDKDVDGDECLVPREFVLTAERPNPMDLFNRPPREPTVGSTLMFDAAAAELPNRLLTTYDRNRDKKLAAEELGWPSSRLARLDLSQDGSLDLKELAGLKTASTDLHVSIALGKTPKDVRPIELRSTSGKTSPSKSLTQSIPVEFAHASIELVYQPVDDPVGQSIKASLELFERVDADKNGYLEPSELGFDFPGGRVTFAAIDVDGDDKVFPGEIEEYTSVRAQPAATGLRVVVGDQGYGFFAAVDKNGDGKISVREARLAGQRLSSLERDKRAGVGAKEPARHLRLEFSRGTFVGLQPARFGPPRPTPRPEPREIASGPIWFQRMDRNQDGDVSWKEFLGPRDAFVRLDRDRDGLIDPDEAVLADR
jgi:Ca2+-binding EF-hand superfamily protein